MDVSELGRLMEDMLAWAWRIVEAGRRSDVLNERFLHHRFSALLDRRSIRKGEDLW